MNFTNLNQLIGSNFRVIREEKGISQEYVADKLNSGNGKVSEFETGKGNPTLKTIVQFAKAIEVDVEDLFDFSELRKTDEYFTKESLLKIHYNTLAKHDIEDIKYIIDTTNVFIDYLSKK